ncbi:predicted protein [Streptomyces sp. AA4]|nr:predicted protein [Streptomyces sp. AA4]
MGYALLRTGDEQVSEAALEDRGVIRRVSAQIVTQHLLAQLGCYTILPVLPVLLGRLGGGLSAWFIGVALFAFNAAIRGASLFCGGMLHRSRVRDSMTAGLLVAAAGFVALPVAPGTAGVLVCLLVAGIGISVNGLMARVYVVMRLSTSGARNTVFSAIQTAANVAAALGPLIGNLLLGGQYLTPLLLLVAGLYAVAAVVAFATVPADLRPGDDAVRPPLRMGILKVVMTDPVVRRISLVVAAGLFLYGQFFSAVALKFTQLTESSAVRAAAFVTNAVLVVVLLIPFSAYARRRLAAGVRPFGFLLAGVGLFAVSFAVMAATGETLVGAFAAVVLFSIAEAVISPMISTVFGDLTGDRPAVEVFNMRQVATTAGESLGGFAGGALFLTASAHNVGYVYWIGLAALGALVVSTQWRRRKNVS